VFPGAAAASERDRRCQDLLAAASGPEEDIMTQTLPYQQTGTAARGQIFSTEER